MTGALRNKKIILWRIILLGFYNCLYNLEALTLVGPTRQDAVLDPLVVLHLNNQLYM